MGEREREKVVTIADRSKSNVVKELTKQNRYRRGEPEPEPELRYFASTSLEFCFYYNVCFVVIQGRWVAGLS